MHALSRVHSKVPCPVKIVELRTGTGTQIKIDSAPHEGVASAEYQEFDVGGMLCTSRTNYSCPCSPNQRNGGALHWTHHPHFRNKSHLHSAQSQANPARLRHSQQLPPPKYNGEKQSSDEKPTYSTNAH